MQVVYRRCCGLDVHHNTFVACVLLTDPEGTVHSEVHRFGAMTADLLALNDWLNLQRVEPVAMERRHLCSYHGYLTCTTLRPAGRSVDTPNRQATRIKTKVVSLVALS